MEKNNSTLYYAGQSLIELNEGVLIPGPLLPPAFLCLVTGVCCGPGHLPGTKERGRLHRSGNEAIPALRGGYCSHTSFFQLTGSQHRGGDNRHTPSIKVVLRSSVYAVPD